MLAHLHLPAQRLVLRCGREKTCVVLARRSRGGSKTTGGQKQDQKGKKKKPGSSSWMKEVPVLSRCADGALIMGDIVMLAATELSSTRILWNDDLKYLLGVMVATWLVSAFSMGDYRGVVPESDNFFIQSFLGPTYICMLDATVTWALAAVLSILTYSVLVQQCVISPAPLMDGLGTDDLSPQLEVAVASLITMPCWRGIAAKIRFR